MSLILFDNTAAIYSAGNWLLDKLFDRQSMHVECDLFSKGISKIFSSQCFGVLAGCFKRHHFASYIVRKAWHFLDSITCFGVKVCFGIKA
jgi:hypothetical protein